LELMFFGKRADSANIVSDLEYPVSDADAR
jgi:hypothetical protein